MEIDLSPKLAKQVYGGDGGAYYSWCPEELPMLRQGNIGAAKLALEKNGFALPRYSDSAKVAYVLQGSGVAGIILPEKEEKVVAIKKGDAIALPFGVVTWWYNKEDTELVVLFLGDTKTGHKAGSFTDFFLTGSNGIFTGFTTEFVSRAWNLDEDVVKTLVGSQSAKGIVKLDPGHKMPEPKSEHRNGMALNCEEAPLDVDIKGGGKVVVLNTKNLPLVGEVGFGADLVRLDGHAMCSPGFSCDSALQVTYIVRGSGRVQIVGVDGKRVLETTVKAGGKAERQREMAPLKSMEAEYPLIDSNFQQFCASHGIFSVEDFLVHDIYMLVALAEEHDTSDRLKQAITQILSIVDGQHQPWLNGFELLEYVQKSKNILSTGCERIDAFLQGGLREGFLTELVGQSSSGKTQLCLLAAANIAKRYLGKVLFLDTGNSFSPKRIAYFISNSPEHADSEANRILAQVLDNIQCRSVFDIFTLLDVLQQLLNNLIYQIGQHLRLLIVDSISSLITPVLGGAGKHGHALMASAGFLLKKLAHEYNLSVLMTNHMVAGEGGVTKPALGESWKSIPHIRLLLSRDRLSNICSMSILRHPSRAIGERVGFTIL